MVRYDFASDNTAGICPEASRALQEANHDTDKSYGDDRWTRRLRALVREIFETDCEVFMVFNGTAANSLAIAQVCRPFHAVVCHERAHIQTDECGGPEFMSGGAKLLTVSGVNGKIDLAAVEELLSRYLDVHSSKPRLLSVTESTEFGTVYTRDELARIAEFARSRGLLLHMDGARFANAIASLGCKPKEITIELGVDVLCFGGTKNGTGGGELVVFFNQALAEDFDYRVKQSAQLASKMRFLSAPWCGLLDNGVWLRNAQHSNSMAELLADKLREASGLAPKFPRQANAIFVEMPNELSDALRDRGWQFAEFFQPGLYRLMCSWATTEERIDEFIADVKDIHARLRSFAPGR